MTDKELIAAHPDYRAEARERGISMFQKTKVDTIKEIEAWVKPPEPDMAEPVEEVMPPREPVTWAETINVIPDGVQTMSKMPSRHVDPLYPKYIDKGKGAHVWADGHEYIDYPCGLGTILLGYADDRVNAAVKEQLDSGNIFSLPNRLETVLAEKLVEIIPCAEQVRFVKTGTEATMAAVKIARAATGREGIVACGYHGWANWYGITTNGKKGIPRSLSALAGQVDYGDMDMIVEMFSLSNVIQKEVAAIILEPYIYDCNPEFLRWVVKFAHDNGALVIFDEVVTGFRTKGFSAQNMFGITPDLACFGKAMANGIPISVVCGKKRYMAEIQGDCFVSSTFGGDLIGISAALETIRILETEPVIDHIWEMGTRLIDGFNEISKDMPDAKMIGLPCRTSFELPSETHRTVLWQECIKRGVLFGYAQFINYSHTKEDIDETLDALACACEVLRQNWDEPNRAFDAGVTAVKATVKRR